MGRLFSAKIENKVHQQVIVEATFVPIQGKEREKLIQRIEAGQRKDFAQRKTDKGSQMYIESLSISDGQNREKVFNGPFIQGTLDKDKKNIIIEETEDLRGFVLA